MAERFFAKQGIVRELREKLGLKQTAFDGVSDVIVRKMEAGDPVSLKSARKVAQTLNVTLERIADCPESAQQKVPEIDIRVDAGRETSATYGARRVTGEEIAALLEGTFDQRFVAYGPIAGIRADNSPRKQALEELESLIKVSRETQVGGYRETVTARSISELIERGQVADLIQTCIGTLQEQGIYVLATNALNKDWYRYVPAPDGEERVMFPDADFENDFRSFRCKWVTVFVLTIVDIDWAHVIASDMSDQCLEML